MKTLPITCIICPHRRTEGDDALDAQTLQNLLREKLGWRVGPHTAAYIIKRLASKKAQRFPILASDARTGRPIAATFDPASLSGNAQPTLF